MLMALTRYSLGRVAADVEAAPSPRRRAVMIFYVAAIAAVLLTVMYLASSDPSPNAKIVVGGMVGLSLLFQLVIQTQPLLVVAILLQVIVCFAVMIHLKLIPMG
jgi:hypothetical protein